MSKDKLQPEDFELETSTVWSFRRRGNWATHKSSYRGNWAPEVVRNLLLRYSDEGDSVLDPMVGGGTTLVECKLTNRNCLGVDINSDAIKLCKEAIDFDIDTRARIKVRKGDARNLEYLDDESIDLITAHPPYANIIEYSEGEIADDLSSIKDIDDFYNEMELVAKELFRVLKPGKYCAVLMGDTRKNKHHVPMSFNVMQRFLDIGFVLKENIIKHQWNTKTEGFWAKRSREYNFLLIKHEHLFVFRKPDKNEDVNKLKYSKN
jgi:DNA modification methylase